MTPDYRWIIDSLTATSREVAPGACVAWKWAEEDLVPGLSDIDARVICVEPGSLDPDPGQPWIALDARLGELHREMVRARPYLARLLEHPPGLGITVAEMLDPDCYHPEFRSWTLPDPALSPVRQALAARPWDERDVAYHLKRLAAYLAPYDREIDPPVNLESARLLAYGYHSRAMHYLAPALLSAGSLVERAPLPGKRAAVRYWRSVLPRNETLRRIEGWLVEGYPTQALDEDTLDHNLYATLGAVARVTVDSLDLARALDPVAAIRAASAALPADPRRVFLEGVWYARIRAGRFRFYAHPPDGFDTAWLVENETRLVRSLMAEGVWAAYAALRGLSVPAREIPGRLIAGRPKPRWGDSGRAPTLDAVEVAAAEAVFALVDDLRPAGERLADLADVWPDYSRALEKLRADLD